MAELPNGAGPTLLTTASTSQTIYTAGGASTWAILRTIHVACEHDTSCKITVGKGTSNTDAAGKRFVRAAQLLAGETWEWSGFLYLAGHASTPDLIYALTDQTNGATITLGVVTGP